MDSRLIEVAKETVIIICRAAVCTSFWPTALGVCGTTYLLLFLPLSVSSVWPVGFLDLEHASTVLTNLWCSDTLISTGIARYYYNKICFSLCSFQSGHLESSKPIFPPC